MSKNIISRSYVISKTTEKYNTGNEYYHFDKELDQFKVVLNCLIGSKICDIFAGSHIPMFTNGKYSYVSSCSISISPYSLISSQLTIDSNEETLLGLPDEYEENSTQICFSDRCSIYTSLTSHPISEIQIDYNRAHSKLENFNQEYFDISFNYPEITVSLQIKTDENINIDKNNKYNIILNFLDTCNVNVGSINLEDLIVLSIEKNEQGMEKYYSVSLEGVLNG